MHSLLRVTADNQKMLEILFENARDEILANLPDEIEAELTLDQTEVDAFTEVEALVTVRAEDKENFLLYRAQDYLYMPDEGETLSMIIEFATPSELKYLMKRDVQEGVCEIDQMIYRSVIERIGKKLANECCSEQCFLEWLTKDDDFYAYAVDSYKERKMNELEDFDRDIA